MRADRKTTTTTRPPVHLSNTLNFLRKPRVLVVDDDLETGSHLTKLAGEDNYEIVSVHDGAAAYRMLKTDAIFCAAIINMTMPQIQGLDILRYMKTENRLRRIPVVIVTGENDLRLMIESFSAGAVAFLKKPCAAGQLWRMVRAVSARASAQTQSLLANVIPPYQSVPS